MSRTAPPIGVPAAHRRRYAAAFVGMLGIVIAIATVVHAPRPAAAGSAGLESGVFLPSGVELTDGATVRAGQLSPLTIRVAGSGTQSVKLVLDGSYLGADTSPPFSFAVAAPAVGKHKLRSTVRDAGAGVEATITFTVVDGSTTAATSVSSASSSTSRSPTVSSAHQSSSTSTTGTGGSGTAQVVVTDAISLQTALSRARPGTTITLADGVYSGLEVKNPSGLEPGRFLATASGTASAPITLKGSRLAVLDGGGAGGGYAVHLKGASYWVLQGFTVRSASKGIVLDNSQHNTIDNVHVTGIGDEGIHFRSFSSDNLLTNSTIDNTGVRSPNYGEGVYIGSARSNWATYSGGQPDRSDRNRVINNTIVDTAAENIDIKEGSSGGIVRGNILGGDKIASKNSADSWIDVKGNGYLIDSNHGHTSPRPGTTTCGDPQKQSHSTSNPFCDGMQVHVILAGWGQNNVFRNNILEVNAPGAGIWLQNTAVSLGNVIECSNKVTGAAAGAFATNHYSALACKT